MRFGLCIIAAIFGLALLGEPDKASAQSCYGSVGCSGAAASCQGSAVGCSGAASGPIRSVFARRPLRRLLSRGCS
jgi:hypothetical protein